MPEFARRLAVDRPEQVAIRDQRVALGWAAVGDTLDRVANRLLTPGLAGDLGADRRVAVFAENSVETALAHLGGLLGSTSTVPVNFHLTADEAAYILIDSASAIVFVGPETVERALAAVAIVGQTTGRRPTVIGWRGDAADAPGDEVIDWATWVAGGPAGDPPLDVVPRANLLYTSGTTGRPKGTELPPSMFAGGPTMAEHLDALKLNRFAAFGTHLVVGPMYHTGPLSGMRLLVAGIPSVILDRFDAEGTLATIQSARTQTAVMVPTHFVRLLALPDEVKAKYDVSSMQLVAHTGAACPVDVKRAMIDWWGPIFVDAYGATEVGTTCSITSDEWLQHPGSVGRAVPPFEALVIDEDGVEVAPMVEGRLYFRDATGRGIVYPNDAAKTAAAHIAPGVFTLGEIGYVDHDGYVFITDRFSDMVVSGGANIYPAEAEHVLIQHPGVADVACVGVPHAEMGEQLKALVVAADRAAPPDPRQLIEFCRARLSHFKCPRSVDFVDDLGRTAMGKLDKRRLRAAFWRDTE
jgi:long-chain acyl-CoA synthetase